MTFLKRQVSQKNTKPDMNAQENNIFHSNIFSIIYWCGCDWLENRAM